MIDLFRKPLIRMLIAQSTPGSAQNSTQDSAREAADQTRELISKITGPKILQALIIIVVCYLTIKGVDALVIWLSEQVARHNRLRIKQFQPFVRTTVMTITVILLMNLFLNLSRENVLAVTGTVAVALGFAFKDYASSIIAGIVGLFEAPYRVGDRVAIADEYGEVVSYGLRGIRLQTPSDNIVTIPHSHIWTNPVSNANMGELEAQVVTEFYLDHEVNPEQVENILYRIAYTSKYTHLKLPITVVMSEHSWGSLYKLRSYPLDARDEFAYKTDLTVRAKKEFTRHGLSYPKRFDLLEDDQQRRKSES
ncbi:transporter, MscS family [Synechococcus sp. PCC 7335]|uniref:mechanosensitive ion channel family protein n=1 Tax=Synechococcus sp. (strain ATCC 29403 / PCC 7335) TaxID=91464 RepID=UPI00017ED8CF|nr:mechanosensitive ion channel family protein [Synechococcus sp. PCC 7335]EDX86580.1 transporter, MscS family [Synechococcus sp. PCC 7335]